MRRRLRCSRRPSSSPDRPPTCSSGGPPGIRTPNLRIKSLVETWRSEGHIGHELRVCVSVIPLRAVRSSDAVQRTTNPYSRRRLERSPRTHQGKRGQRQPLAASRKTPDVRDGCHKALQRIRHRLPSGPWLGTWLGLVSEDPTEHYGTRQFEGDLCGFGPLGLLSCS